MQLCDMCYGQCVERLGGDLGLQCGCVYAGRECSLIHSLIHLTIHSEVTVFDSVIPRWEQN